LTPWAEGQFFVAQVPKTAIAYLFAVSHPSCFRIAQNQCSRKYGRDIALPCSARQE
jgi:hypothetical protein